MSDAPGDTVGVRDPSPALPFDQVRVAYIGVAVAFTLNGLLLGTWAPRIPEVQAHLGIGPGDLGFTLLALAVGSLCAMPLTGWVMSRHGSSKVLLPATLAACLLPGLIGTADSMPGIWPILLLWGIALGAMDVAMNTQAVAVQHHHPRTVINGIHACFSLGGLLGAALGTGASAASIPVTWHLVGVGLCGLVASVLVLRKLVPDPAASPSSPDEPAGPSAPARRRGTMGALALLCAAAFGAMLAEGAVADWSAIRMKEAGVSTGAAGIGYTDFALAMFIGRACGDTIAQRVGHTRMAAAVALVGCLGTLVGFALPSPAAAALAFAALGLGLSCIMPFLFALAGGDGSGTPVAVTAVGTSGYVGLLVGPAAIGVLAELYGIVAALWVLPVLLLLSGLPAVAAARSVNGRT
ncbi:MFS transporter [Streptomyces tubercidicus]|uniref:MFS transporter n=1 Tax=Streptomyces tubercidicus TaxID=47759 RepID=UPI002E19CB12|nr:MFS transporter [Streptomyces tubercidicus]